MSDTSLFDGLTAHERETLLRASREEFYDDGDRLFDEGGHAGYCWLIRHGRVALDTTVPGRGHVVIQTLGPGDLLGWSWLIPPYRWHFGARAVGTVEATVFDAEQLRVLADQDPRLGYVLTRQLLAVVLDRLQSTRARLLDLYRHD
ncbi:cyclic nucleotide-binding protein [Kribbella sp. VKM Ac-2571]|uniref:Crp/Fnr family transcriptional regulator n=1 Tax=Kribbella sp. VKM Ac-2571 TaxID=2512222 RepID=UPI00105E9AA7|nr:cyclic nucleotide-binding domain-containing protein [Kribbella sp. VKM Ac-2571]TDO58749.1 cyclic nucleotide-binding protein [Kribbella sp. VKM Ac-2571]